jgi:hypothetical protein
MRYKTPKLKEKVAMYEKFLHALNMGVTCVDNEMVRELVSNADRWSYAHRRGEFYTDKERQKIIDAAFWQLCDTPEADKATKERQKTYAEKQTV